MEAVETLLLFLVSLSVLLSLIRVHLQINFVNVVDDNSQDQNKTRFEQDENNFKNSQEEIIAEYKTDENSLNAEKQVICENSEETEWIDDDDWVGVETSDLDKFFGEAMVFVSCNEDLKNMDELCLLQQLVLQGPSQGSSAPSNSRNAWEEVSRETAMKKYIELLSEAIPDWKCGLTSSL